MISCMICISSLIAMIDYDYVMPLQNMKHCYGQGWDQLETPQPPSLVGMPGTYCYLKIHLNEIL